MQQRPRSAARIAALALGTAATAALLCVLPAAASATTLVIGYDDAPSSVAATKQVRAAGVPEARVLAKHGIPKLDAVTVEVPARQVAAVRAKLLARGDVEYVEVDHRARAFADAPNDPFLAEQWGFEKLGVLAAWDVSRGAGITVAVVDTGVDASHPDLQGVVLPGVDYVDDDDDPSDEQGHGTHVAGVVAAIPNDGFGIAGIAPDVKILPIRVLDAEGSGDYSDVATGIVFAADQGARVINLSLGGTEESTTLRDAVDYAASKGAIVTCATGNETATTIGYPARYDSCEAVGASDVNDVRGGFSNIGEGIDIVAPGVGIFSSIPGATHDSWDGTSMASPYVAGAAALLLATGASRADAIAALHSSAIDLGAPGPDIEYGFGRVDAAGALGVSARTPRSTDSAAPVVSKVVGSRVGGGKTTFRKVWKTQRTSRWVQVGVTDFRGKYSWTETTRRGVNRTLVQFRMTGGKVFGREIRQRLVNVPSGRTGASTIRLRATATDDVAVNRVAFRVAGKQVGVDWSPAGGWTLDVKCTGKAIMVTATAWDAADRSSAALPATRIAC